AGAVQNVAFYKDANVDKLLSEAQATADQATRAALYAVIQDQLSADAPWVPIAHSEQVVAARAQLEGVVLSPTGHPVYPLIGRATRRRDRTAVGERRSGDRDGERAQDARGLAHTRSGARPILTAAIARCERPDRVRSDHGRRGTRVRPELGRRHRGLRGDESV